MSEVRLVRDDPGAALAPIIGECLAVRRAADLARRFAPGSGPILLLGATGTGKELFAQHVHAWSGRTGEVVDINCAALPRELVEGLLFGHRQGAFTGAVDAAPGLVEAADGGTLFLDEVGSLALEVQAKLLRVLENGEVRRLGEIAKRRVDFRLVAAAQAALGPAIEEGHFRLDLYQRIAGVVIELPPLAERGEDVVLLARHFTARCGRTLSPEAERVLQAHPWPGNVRQLAVAVERAARLSEGRTLNGDVLKEAIALGAANGERRDGVESGHAAARRRLLDTCAALGWDAGRVAAALAVSPATLYRRLEAFGISLRAYRKNSHILLRQTENS